MVKLGRPLIEIDWAQFDKLCQVQATLAEISGWFDCSEDTIERAVKREHDMLFADYFKKKSAGGKVSLRRKQYQSALGGSVPMMIWLGKQHLGQKDRTEVDTNVKFEGMTDSKLEERLNQHDKSRDD